MLDGQVSTDPQVMSNTPVFAGTQVPGGALFDYIEGGDTLFEVLDKHPSVSKEAAVEVLGKAKVSLRSDRILAKNWNPPAPLKVFIGLILIICCVTQSCDSQTTAKPRTDSDTTKKQTKFMSDYSPEIDKAHPNAKRLMNEEFYWSPIEETGPFGSDDGADTYAGFADWRQENKNGDPQEFLREQISYWGYPTFDLQELNFAKLKLYLKKSELGSRFMSGIDTAIAAIAFGQLYLEGTIEKAFKELAKTSIKRELIPELLDLWGESYKATRETQLRKMLAVLDQVE